MDNAATWLIRKLEQYDVLSEEEVAALARLPQNEHAVPENLDIVVEGSRPVASILLIEGYCALHAAAQWLASDHCHAHPGRLRGPAQLPRQEDGSCCHDPDAVSGGRSPA